MYTRATFAGPLARAAAALLVLGCSDVVTSEHRFDGALSPALDAVPVAGQTLYVPTGFNVNLFAEGLDGARSLALGPDGAVFVTLSGDGEIVRLVDADGDGVADARTTVLSGLSYPFGLAFRGDTMYFAEQNAVSRLDPGAPTPVTLIPNLPVGDHVTRTIAFGPDNRLYVAIGSSCNVCDDALPRAAVTRYNLDGSNPHTFATGLRNSVGLAFHPTTGELWANNNDRDGLGDDVPPEHLNILRDGRWYGWPQCYLPGQANPEYQGADCSGVEPPALTFQAHSAPLGLAFYTGTTFPAEYQGDAFMTYHGSWNRTEPTGAKVVSVRVQDGRPTAVEDFVTGWQLADGSRWGRPVGLLVLPDGALLVSDDWGGRIWRVSFGQRPQVNEAGDLEVTTATAGSDPDPNGYTVTLDGSQARAIGTNSSVTFTNVSAGSHTVALTNVAANCTVSDPNPQTVTVPSGGTVTAAFEASCTTPPGSLRVTTSTSGSSVPNGYTVTVDGDQSQTIGTNSSVTFTNVSAGSHSVALTNGAANCTVSDPNPQSVTVLSGATVTAAFSVSCTTPPGNLRVTTSTSGSSVPSGYTVNVDGNQSQTIGTNSSVTFTNVTAGSHTVALTDVAANCTVSDPNPQTVTVPASGTVTAAFSVSCTTPPGNLRVTTSTSGSSVPSGYTVNVDGNQSQTIGTNSSVTFTNVSAGSHTVALTNVAANCTVSDPNPQIVTVPSGGTVTAAFSASCTTPPGNLRVTTSTSGSSLPSGYTVTVDGSQSQTIGTNSSVTFTNVSAGGHSVALTNGAANCTVSDPNPQSVTVLSGETVTAAFSASCVTPNRPPVVNAGSDQAVLVGLGYSLTDVSFSDPDNDGPWSYTIDWGDASSFSGSRSTQGSLAGTHNYLLPGSYSITVTVTDSHGARGSDSKVLTVGSLPVLSR